MHLQINMTSSVLKTGPNMTSLKMSKELFSSVQFTGLHHLYIEMYHDSNNESRENAIISRVYNREGPISLWYCVAILSQVHDLCNNIYKLEVSWFAVCGHASKSLHPLEHHYTATTAAMACSGTNS